MSRDRGDPENLPLILNLENRVILAFAINLDGCASGLLSKEMGDRLGHRGLFSHH